MASPYQMVESRSPQRGRGRPQQPLPRFPAHPVPAGERAAQEGAQGGRRLDHAANGVSRPGQRVGVVNAVTASGCPWVHLVSSVRPAPAHLPGQRACRRAHADPGAWARVTGRSSPALATRRRSCRRLIRMRSGSLMVIFGSCFEDGLPLQQPLSPMGNFLTPSAPPQRGFQLESSGGGCLFTFSPGNPQFCTLQAGMCRKLPQSNVER